MKYALATLTLGPLLVLQGQRVRRTVPTLPEPPGVRVGTCGNGSPLRLLILGDSAAAGVGAPDQHNALSGQLVARLATHYCVDWRLVARSGDNVGQVIDHLQRQRGLSFDVALLSVGVNDVIGRTTTSKWQQHLQRLIESLAGDFSVRHIVLTALPPMHAFAVLPQPLRWYLGLRAAQLTHLARRVAAKQPACELLSLQLPAHADFLAADGFHPSPAAYAQWAALAATAIRRRQTTAHLTESRR